MLVDLDITHPSPGSSEGASSGVGTTSTWLRDKVAPESLHEIIDAYEAVVHNLNAHVHPDSPYPTAQSIRSVVRSGPPVSK